MGDRLSRLERTASIVIPPACREEVLGDLHERNTTSLQYVLDAVRTVPLVIASRIRRTWDGKLFAMYAVSLYGSFLFGRVLEPGRLLQAAIPSAAALIILALDEAYAEGPSVSVLGRLRRPAFVCIAALIIRGNILGLIWALVIQALFHVPTKLRRGPI